MKKRYIFLIFVIIITVIFLLSVMIGTKDDSATDKSNMPRIGQYLWTYNMNKSVWREYSKNDDMKSKETVVFQLGYPEGNGGYTVYQLFTGNSQILKDELWFGEGSEEFLKNKTLYSYYPRMFEYYKIVFNGVTFIPDKLSVDEVSNLFKGYNILKVSSLKKGENKVKFAKNNNKFIVINDIGEKFYKYYIIPNDSKKMQIEDYSNQFSVSSPVDIRLQRIEGCTKAYPCYDVHIEK